jgi:hypothetical protein
MADEQWGSISQDLKQLGGDPALALLKAPLEKLHQVSMAEPKPVPAESMAIVVDILRQMRGAIAAGAAPGDVVKDGPSKFVQPNWSPEQVNQAAQIFQFYLSGQGSEAPPDPTVQVPIVLVAMTASEADQLSTGSGVGDQLADTWPDFGSLRTILEREVPNWTERYGATATDWKPFAGQGGDDRTVVELVSDETTALSENLASRNLAARVAPRFIDIRDLRGDRGLLRGLRDQGCVVVVDGVSMVHPALHVAFHDCYLDPFMTTSIVTISPTDALKEARLLSVVFKLKLGDFEWAKRAADRTVKMSQSMDTTSVNDFGRWMFERVQYFSGTEPEATGVKAFMKYKAV